jgi:hypothetical protein
MDAKSQAALRSGLLAAFEGHTRRIHPISKRRLEGIALGDVQITREHGRDHGAAAAGWAMTTEVETDTLVVRQTQRVNHTLALATGDDTVVNDGVVPDRIAGSSTTAVVRRCGVGGRGNDRRGRSHWRTSKKAGSLGAW